MSLRTILSRPRNSSLCAQWWLLARKTSNRRLFLIQFRSKYMFSKFARLPAATLTALMIAALAGSITTLGCASNVKKADISASANPSEELASLETDIQAGYQSQYDILAAKEFTAAAKGL